MTFPFVFDDDFEEGTVADSGWDSETDTAAQLSIDSYRTLAAQKWPTCSPYRGAYCLRAVLSGGTADAFLVEGDINLAASTNNFFRFYIWFDPDFAGTADDTVNIFEGLATTTVEVTFGFRVVASTGVINLGIGETAPTSWSSEAIERGVWYCVELDVTIDTTATDGTIDLYVTKEGSPWSSSVAATQVGSLGQGALTQGYLGIQGHLATTTGTILIDEFIQDDTRVYPIKRRFDDTRLLTKSGHVFVGPGKVDNVTLLSGADTDNIAILYDTNQADTTSDVEAELRNTANNETVDTAISPVDCIRGAYVTLAGTNPRALVKIEPAAFSVATVRHFGR